MSYSLLFHPAAKKELAKLDHQVRLFIVDSLSIFIDSYNANYEAELMKQAKILSSLLLCPVLLLLLSLFPP